MKISSSFLMVVILLGTQALGTPQEKTRTRSRKPATSVRDQSSRNNQNKQEAQQKTDQELEQRKREEEIRQQRETAKSLLNSLVDESSGYKDRALRITVLVRVAEILAKESPEHSRQLLQNAWDELERWHRETEGREERIRGLRQSLISAASLEFPLLAEEFFNKLEKENKEQSKSSGMAEPNFRPLAPLASEDTRTRLEFANDLLGNGHTEQSIRISEQGLQKINVHGLLFLARLREKNKSEADRIFLSLLKMADGDPGADANTVSILSSYVLTPYLVVTVNRQGYPTAIQFAATGKMPDLPSQLLGEFFSVAARILLRQMGNESSAGINGTYAIIRRLMPVFNQFAPLFVAPLAEKMKAIESDVASSLREEQRDFLSRGLESFGNQNETGQKSRSASRATVDSGQNKEESDEIAKAISAARRGDVICRELVARIERSEESGLARFVEMMLIDSLSKEDCTEQLLAALKGTTLSGVDKAWAVIRAAKLLLEKDKTTALALLSDAAREAEANKDKNKKARILIGIAKNMLSLDSERAWLLIEDAVKSANRVTDFRTGNQTIESRYQLSAKGGLQNYPAPDFTIPVLFREIALTDFQRTIQMARSFTSETVRVQAVLSAVRSFLSMEADNKQSAK